LSTATNTTTSHRTGVTNVSKTNNNDYYHDYDSEEERKEKVGQDSQGRIHRKGQEVQREKGLSDLWATTMSEHIETRKKLKEIASVSSFTSLINSATLSHTDKQILVLHYIDGKDFRYIGDTLGYSESTIKKRHKKALKKLSQLF